VNKKPYGPVPVSRIKPEAKTIFEALAAGRPVHISRYGRVIAVIDPPASIPQELLAEYALGDHVGLPELTATEINQGAPAAAIFAVAAHGPRYVTRERRVRGLLRGATDSDLATSEPSDEQLAERERRLAEYVETHPETDISALADYGDQIDQELGISQGETGVRPLDLLEEETLQQLREYIKEASRQFAVTAGDLVDTSPRVASGRDEIVREFESLTTEAMAGVTGVVLDGIVRRTKVHEVEVTRLRNIEHRAEVALSSLDSSEPSFAEDIKPRVRWSDQSIADMESIGPVVRDQLRRNAQEILHDVQAPTAHEGAEGGIMWHRGITHEQERLIETGMLWEEGDDEAKAWDYFLFYRRLNPGQFEVLAVRSIHKIAAQWVQVNENKEAADDVDAVSAGTWATADDIEAALASYASHLVA
jgi:hypothetical protein